MKKKTKNKWQHVHNDFANTKSNLVVKKRITLPVWFIAFSIAIITFIVFSPALKCGFTNFDDQKFIVRNPLIVSNTIEVKKIFTSIVTDNDYYPVTILSYTFNYQLGKLNPFGFHLWNVLLHVINTLLVFWFIFILTRRKLLMATIVALFFGIHPMHVESVAWLTERKDVLFMFFFLFGLITYLRFRESGKWWWYLTTTILLILSCLSKGTAVVFPFILILIDYLMNDKLNKKVFIEKIPLFIISITFLILTYWLHKTGSLQSYSEHKTVVRRIIFASYDFLWYVIKFVIPVNLSAFYTYPAENAMPLTYYLAPFILICLTACVYFFMRKQKEILFGFLFYFFSIVLMLQFIPTGSGEFNMADRYTYLAYIGLLFVIAYFINLMVEKHYHFRHLIIGTLFIYAVIFSYQAYSRTKVWQNSETLWSDVVAKNPDGCFIAYYSLGIYYQNEEKNSGKAFENYNNALKIYSDSYLALTNRGALYTEQNKYELAIADLNRAIELNPNYYQSYNNRGLVYFNTGQLDLAMKDYDKSLALDSTNAMAYNNRGLVYYKKGERDLALMEYNKALAFNPNLENVYYNRGLLYDYAFKQNDLALADYNNAIVLNIKYTEVYFYRGILLIKMGKNESAIADFSKAIELNAGIPDYWINRSMAENASGKKEEAVADVIKAQQLGMQVDPAYLNELGIK